LDYSKISPLQFAILLVSFLLGSSLITQPGLLAGRHTWLALIIGVVAGLLLAWGFAVLANRFPGKTLVEINDLVYGAYMGKFISILYLWFLLHLATLVLHHLCDFITIIVPHTPRVVLMVFLLLVCASAARCGVEVIARCSLILVPLTFIACLFITTLATPIMDFKHFLPISHIDVAKLAMAALGASTFPFAESVAFLMVAFAISGRAHPKKAWTAGILIAGAMFAIITVRNIAVLGPVYGIFLNFPSHAAVRTIELGEVLTRLDLLLVVQFLTMGFLKLSVLYYGVALGTAQLFKITSYKPVILPLGAIIVNLSLLQFRSFQELINFAENTFPFYTIPFAIIIPLLTLLISSWRKPPIAQGEAL